MVNDIKWKSALFENLFFICIPITSVKYQWTTKDVYFSKSYSLRFIIIYFMERDNQLMTIED